MDDKRLTRIEDKLDKIAENLTEHTVIHARNTTSLEHHIDRTNKLEVIVQQNKSNIESTLVPLKQTDTILRACLKTIAVLATILTIAISAIKLIKGI